METAVRNTRFTNNIEETNLIDNMSPFIIAVLFFPLLIFHTMGPRHRSLIFIVLIYLKDNEKYRLRNHSHDPDNTRT